VRVTVPLGDDLALTMADAPEGDGYPTSRLQRGLSLLDAGADLAGEGVGFGVPVVKRGAQTVFPGAVRLSERAAGGERLITAEYRLDLVERLAAEGGRGPSSASFYALRDAAAALHRRVPVLRGPLTAVSNRVRRRYGWQTTFEQAAIVATLAVTYRINDAGRLRVTLDTTGLSAEGVTEVVVMNELGAGLFDQYLDSDGARLRGRRIGTWDEVCADGACFASTSAGVAFRLTQVPGARLYRGREVVGARLAWAGFGYSLRPCHGRCTYDVHVLRAP
jgi:hypothetical protein